MTVPPSMGWQPVQCPATDRSIVNRKLCRDRPKMNVQPLPGGVAPAVAMTVSARWRTCHMQGPDGGDQHAVVLLSVTFSLEQIDDVRHRIRELSLDSGLTGDYLTDWVMAINELT